MSEFCKHDVHESMYCGSCINDTITALQSQLAERDEVLREFYERFKHFTNPDTEYGRLVAKAQAILKERDNG